MLRRARPDDVDAIVRIFRDSRAEAMPWLPVLHTAEDDCDFFGRSFADGHEFWVAEVDGEVAGFAGLQDAFLNQLYVDPGFQRKGIGGALFARAKQSRPEGFRWWVFQWNDRARRFYEARGGVVIELNDAGGEEQLPDALYEWAPPRPRAEFRES
jgi:GNAT superfamily N-acetyltransferase